MEKTCLWFCFLYHTLWEIENTEALEIPKKGNIVHVSMKSVGWGRGCHRFFNFYISSCLGKHVWAKINTSSLFNFQTQNANKRTKNSAMLLDGVRQQLVAIMLLTCKLWMCQWLTWKSATGCGITSFLPQLSVQVGMEQTKAFVRYVFCPFLEYIEWGWNF